MADLKAKIGALIAGAEKQKKTLIQEIGPEKIREYEALKTGKSRFLIENFDFAKRIAILPR